MGELLPVVAAMIASELARIDGYEPEDSEGGLYDLRWSGGPNPEPEGDAWNMDYMPKGERIAKALETILTSPQPSAEAAPVPAGAVSDAIAEVKQIRADMTDDLLQRLHSTRFADGPVVEAAREIERLRGCLRYEQYRFATQSTHSEGCHTFGPRHYECALQALESAERERDALRERIERSRVEDDFGSDSTGWMYCVPAELIGKRVRLVVEDGGK